MPIDKMRAAGPGGAAALAILAVLVAGAPFSPAGATNLSPGPAAGYARIWLYRDYQPYVTLARPYVRLNGRIVGISEPGGAFYRDVVPGRYEVSVDSPGRDVNQFAGVTVNAGQEIYVEVDALRYANCGVGARGGTCRPTFYTLLRPSEIGAAAVANSTLHGGH